MSEAVLTLPGLPTGTNLRGGIERILEGQTEEMVFALCGAVGSISESLLSAFKKVLKECNYTVSIVKISDCIKKYKNISEREFSSLDYAKQIEKLQDCGNELRKTYGHDILAKYAIQNIAAERKIVGERDGLIKTGEVKAIRRRHVTIIDSLKHYEELLLLRTVYGRMFSLFGILCPEGIREHRLRCDKSINHAAAASIIERDKGQTERYGQKLAKTVMLSDFFVSIGTDNIDNVEKQLTRFVHLLLGDHTLTPTIDEYAMYIAQATALRSGCMARQVGAALVTASGDILATGRNDVPKFNGGLYSCDDKLDNRCMFRTNRNCKNEEGKKSILDCIHGILTDEGISTKTVTKIFERLDGNRQLKGLVEYSRAIHAEMDAIVCAARNARDGLVGSNLYCTTYPCHNCARHIVAAGIKKVYYIEPYEKSLANDLHDDSISVGHDQELEGNKVNMIPFAGVAPRQYMNLFRAEERKREGQLIPFEQEHARPVRMRFTDPFVYYEAIVIKDMSTLSYGSMTSDSGGVGQNGEGA